MTELVLLEDGENVAETLEQLHEIGVGFALDDFGTGYSSLSYLRRFHFDKIKIDQHFHQGAGRAAEELARHRALDRDARHEPRHRDTARGRRDRAAARAGAAGGLHRGAGILHRHAAPRRRDPRDTCGRQSGIRAHLAARWLGAPVIAACCTHLIGASGRVLPCAAPSRAEDPVHLLLFLTYAVPIFNPQLRTAARSHYLPARNSFVPHQSDGAATAGRT